MAVIRTRDLTKRYGRRAALAGVDLDVPEGTIYGFLGPNGAGKTTTIRILLGFLRPTSGRATLLGEDCWRGSHRARREVGYLPGDLRLYPWMSGQGALALLGRIRGRDLGPQGARLAQRLGLDLRLPARVMSRGTRQKLGLVMALAHEPRVLVLDEPTGALDPLVQAELMTCLREMAAGGHTVFLSSHTLSEVEQLCERVAILREGRVVADEALSSLRARATRSVTLVFGSAEAAATLEPPPGLSVLDRTGRTWRAELAGPASPLLGWLAERPVEDLTLGPPDLDNIFRSYYRC